MSLTKQVQRIFAREIRPYILPLPYFDYDDPVLIAAFLSDEDWLKEWASCYIPLRTVCNAMRSLHVGELMVANLLHLRRLPHACWRRSRKNRIACKHGAPWVERLNHVGPLLICTRIAQTRKLKSTGARNVPGKILGVRNNEWLNGTSHVLCMAFAGNNSDVLLSDRISIMAQAHEDSVCKGNCFGKKSLCRMIQRVHPNTNVYRKPFGSSEH